MKIRKEVQIFAEAMETTLQKHEHKGGWKDIDNYKMMSLLEEEVYELKTAVRNGIATMHLTEEVLRECTDVANFCMMLFSNQLVLNVKESEDEK